MRTKSRLLSNCMQTFAPFFKGLSPWMSSFFSWITRMKKKNDIGNKNLCSIHPELTTHLCKRRKLFTNKNIPMLLNTRLTIQSKKMNKNPTKPKLAHPKAYLTWNNYPRTLILVVGNLGLLHSLALDLIGCMHIP